MAINLTGKRAVVVGGTSGIGEGIAQRLAKANASVTIVGRSPERGQEIVRHLSSLGGSNHEFIACDSFVMSNIKEFCKKFTENHQSLDFLVLSQGMATIQGRTETKEGIDQKLALHYFGRMCYINGLLPLLRKAQQPKVLSVLSAGVHQPYTLVNDDFDLKNNFSIANAANAAGYYNDIALEHLSKDAANKDVLFVHAAPGFVSTRWGTEMPWWLRAGIRVLQQFGRSIEDCGDAMCYPLFHHHSPGFLLVNPDGESIGESTPSSKDLSTYVWEKTIDLIGNE